MQIVDIMNKGAHLTLEGLIQIIHIKASRNIGLSETIKNEFGSQIIPANFAKRDKIQYNYIPSPHWISGFIEGEGNFDIGIKKSKNLIGSQVYLRIRICQHSRDKHLMELILNYFKAGRLENQTKRSTTYLVFNRIQEINQIVIPFLNQYPIKGIKHQDFIDWCKVAELIQNGSHLTPKGLEEIRGIKKGMNTGTN